MSGEQIWLMTEYSQEATTPLNIKMIESKYHNLVAVGEVEVANPITPQKFPDLHQTVALL